ncbi:lactate dehydrogenase-like 2-hydroxyacid dehydrogenase [Breoghania corrubedonensis]|uniref:Lactate dehydrogenase-like 2-hydroxyacid dehydrogenase n=1 Tax=Breoghania corrubedonensis TaxID=665038 RepID=A0A2T5VH23_9HYPH|nr:2-hydroxyacid dehydrogenase [Breoghania corrubedonensis]PTW63045.1 lactate dehydrogenase-like 2-hydroxyacid dehydrogenase [Breoghania corrubedonensis]
MDRQQVLVIGPILPYVIAKLGERFDVVELHKEADRAGFLEREGKRFKAVACGLKGIDRETIAALPDLEIISSFGVGYDAVDVAAAAQAGVVVTNTPGVLDEEVANTALALMLMTVRELNRAENHLRAGRWAKDGPYPLTAGSLGGSVLGILGLGRIGKAIARRAEACGMKIHYHGRHEQAGVAYRYHASLTELARASDVLMAVVPGGAATHHMIDRQVLEALGPNGYLINIGRGTVVDETALIEALSKGAIRGAGLDVFENEPAVPESLVVLENTVLLPHVGSASVATRQAMGQLVVDNIVAWTDTRRAMTPVPETPQP